MKLYDVPRNTWVRVLNETSPLPEVKRVVDFGADPTGNTDSAPAFRAAAASLTPPGGLEVKKEDLIRFHHIDGMYSYCTNQDGDVVHLAAWTEVEIAKNQDRTPNQ